MGRYKIKTVFKIKMKKGISSVTVTLKDENDKVLKTVTTNENGKYQFTDLNNG
ncbi:Ser-Asp rich fibrinogen-binding bone sialoprotein-binding protein, partial [Staphylococcus aureus subsp. aureus CGS00]